MVSRHDSLSLDISDTKEQQEQEKIGRLLISAIDKGNNGKLEEAKALYNEVLVVDRTNEVALRNLTVIAVKEQDNDLALRLLEQLLIIAPHNIDYLNEVAACYYRKKDYIHAIEIYDKVLAITSNNLIAVFNKANSLEKLNNRKEALKYYKTALTLSPNNGEIIFGTALCIEALGNFDEAISHYNKLLTIAQANIKWLAKTCLCLFANRQFGKIIKIIGEFKNSRILTPKQIVPLRIIEAKIAFCNGNIRKFSQIMDEINLITSGDHQTMKFFYLIVYYRYLNKINNFYKQNKKLYKRTTDNNIYLIGDSHTLSQACTQVTIKGEEYYCIPKLVVGLQAKHIGEKEVNRFKTALTKVMQEIPKGAKCIFMAGEIDCRKDFGIVPFLVKENRLTNENISRKVKEIVDGYFSYLQQIMKENNIDAIIHGVPAANDAFNYDTPERVKNAVVYTVKIFNDVLKTRCEEHNISFTDPYSFTYVSNNVAKSEYYMDAYHLNPGVLDLLCKRNYY